MAWSIRNRFDQSSIYQVTDFRAILDKLKRRVSQNTFRHITLLFCMKISEYVKTYTSGRRIIFSDIVEEVAELGAEVMKMSRAGMREEFGDVFHFSQLWLYWRFGLDGEPWRITRRSVEKFIARKAVWNKLYAYVGLPENVSGYLGNYKRIEKVVRQLGRFGIEREKAEEAYVKIVESEKGKT